MNKKFAFFFVVVIVIISAYRAYVSRRPGEIAVKNIPNLDFLKKEMARHGISSGVGVSSGGTYVTRKKIFLSFSALKLVVNGRIDMAMFVVFHEAFHVKAFDHLLAKFASHLSLVVCVVVSGFASLMLAAIVSSEASLDGSLALVTIPLFAVAIFMLLRKSYRWSRCIVEHLADGDAFLRCPVQFSFGGAAKLPNHPSPDERNNYLAHGETHYHALLQGYFIGAFFLTSVYAAVVPVNDMLQAIGTDGAFSVAWHVIGSTIVAHAIVMASVFRSSRLARFLFIINAVISVITIAAVAFFVSISVKNFMNASAVDILTSVFSKMGGYWVLAMAATNLIIGVTKWTGFCRPRG